VTWVIAFVVMLVAVFAMAAGALLGRRPIQGSCGGIGRLGLGECEICGGDPARCDAPQSGDERASLGYDATAPAREGDPRRLRA
jgi:hypothetical protein